MYKLTREQKVALLRVAARRDGFEIDGETPGRTLDARSRAAYRSARRAGSFGFGGDCFCVDFAGMFLGIERDGYTHS